MVELHTEDGNILWAENVDAILVDTNEDEEGATPPIKVYVGPNVFKVLDKLEDIIE